MGIKTVPHPPYGPDLAPCDFCLFPKIKKKLRVCRYETIEEMKEAVTKVIDTLTQEDFHGASRSCWNSTTSALQPKEIISKVCTIYKSVHTKKVWKLIEGTSYLVNMYKEYLALNNLQWLICHKTKPNKPNSPVDEAILYADYSSTERQLHSINVLDMILNYLMVRLQFWGFGYY